MTPMRRDDLEHAVAYGCEVPGCTHPNADHGIFLAARCHPGRGVDVGYLDGILHLVCHVCDAPIVNVAVAD
jgi:hypothetical protein